jgi:hypothetical protein
MPHYVLDGLGADHAAIFHAIRGDLGELGLHLRPSLADPIQDIFAESGQSYPPANGADEGQPSLNIFILGEKKKICL